MAKVVRVVGVQVVVGARGVIGVSKVLQRFGWYELGRV